jgi:hypothetical protein
MPFDHARAVCKGECGGDGVEVLAGEAGEGPDRRLAASFALPDPLREEMAAAVSDQVGEGRRLDRLDACSG